MGIAQTGIISDKRGQYNTGCRDFVQQKKEFKYMEKDFLIQDSKPHSLVDYYNAARMYYFNEKEDTRVLFERNNVNKYINHLFANERKDPDIRKCLDKITDFRAKHTVSAFFLGLSVKKMLRLNTKDWKRLPGDSKSSAVSFRLFWTWICMFHDIGYSYEDPKTEEKKTEYAELKTIDDFIKHEDITYSLLDYSDNKDLIRHYYEYRMSQNKLDHGIVGALLLFNALMELANNSNYAGIYSEIKGYQEFYTRICDAIARHNMWRATPDREEIYRRFNLWELIPNADMSHKIYYRDNTLEFLLALVDTIDPLKAFYQNNRSKEPVEMTQILNDVTFRFFRSQKAFIEAFDHPLFKAKITQYVNPDDRLDSWLGIFITIPEDASYMKIEIDTKSGKIKL